MGEVASPDFYGKDPLPTEKYFSESYIEARKKFRDAADSVKKSLVATSVQVSTLLVKDPDYTMDICVIKGSRAHGLLVHSSGVHGVEGYAGSAIQIATLHAMACSGQVPEVTSVFVHAVNPYGMAHFRRWNENNVDLNRNALDDKGWLEVMSRDSNIAGYEDFKNLLVPEGPPSWWFVNVGIWLLSIRLLCRHGFRTLKRCLVTGTYHHKTGIFFGGQELQPSHVLLSNFLKENFSHVPGSEVCWVDVHTGLGPKGVDVLLCDGLQEQKMILENFPGADAQCTADENNTDGSQAAGYELVRGLCKGFYDKLFDASKTKALILTQEFGTKPGLIMARNMVIENRGYHFDYDNHEHWRTYTRDCFYCREPAWKESVLKRGKIVFEQSLNLTRERSKL